MFSRKTSTAALVAAFAAMPVLAMAQVTLSGAITEKQDDHIVLRTSDGDKIVRVAPDTKVTETAGAGVLQREKRAPSDLMRGLTVQIDAMPSQSGQEYYANSITYKKGDMRTARQIDAGVTAERERIAQAEARLDNVGELMPAGRTKVFFDTGSTELSDQAKQDLQAIAAQAKDIKGGFRLAVVGRADPRGNAAANQRLSEKRAAAVTDYLMREAGVRPGSILPQTAIGASPVADDPDKPKTLAEGRRVTVTILVSKANTAVAGRKP